MKIFTFNTLLLFALFAFVSGCKKEDSSNVGNLNLTFKNHPLDITIVIFPVENTTIAVNSFKLNSQGKASKGLLVGNYYLKVNSNTYFEPIGFQILPDKSTSIEWGSSNEATIIE